MAKPKFTEFQAWRLGVASGFLVAHLWLLIAWAVLEGLDLPREVELIVLIAPPILAGFWSIWRATFPQGYRNG